MNKVEPKYILSKTWILKDGTIKTKDYNQQQYTKTFNEKNKEKFKIKLICECGCNYTKSNLYNHNKSIIHKMYLNIMNNVIELE